MHKTIFSTAFKFKTDNGEFLSPCTMRRKAPKGVKNLNPQMYRTSKDGGNILDQSEFEVDESTMIHQVLHLEYSVRMMNRKGQKNIYSPLKNEIIK